MDERTDGQTEGQSGTMCFPLGEHKKWGVWLATSTETTSRRDFQENIE